MSALSLLSDLEHAGVILYLDGQRLRFRAPAGAMTEARRGLITEHRDELINLLASAPVAVSPIGDVEAPASDPAQTPPAEADVAPVAEGDRPWPARTAELIAQLEGVDGATLPAPFRLRPGVIVTEPARFIAGLRAEVDHGPAGLRARRGLVEMDLADLLRVLTAPEAARCVVDLPRLAGSAAPAAEVTPAEHLAQVGGFSRLQELTAPGVAHRLWDAARLWERDRDTPRAVRWAQEYWHHWAAAQVEP